MNNNQKHLDLLEMIFHYVESNESKIPSKKCRYTYSDSSMDRGIEYTNLKCYHFEISKPEMKIRFDISIFRENKFFSNHHMISILPSENKNWGGRLDEIVLNTHFVKYPRKILNKIFDTLEKKESEYTVREKDLKLGGYIEEIQKGVDKSYSRDNKINNILK